MRPLLFIITSRPRVNLGPRAYNLTNTASFRNPNSDLSDGDFGEITRTLGGPRVMQLAMKLRF